ncbi:MAG TPA: ABC transporter substrate-binding protein [Candidatus Binataceae bacterium]|nr:ABC transporter substrate-binding protein [Candidatus Binataceae bacterium]
MVKLKIRFSLVVAAVATTALLMAAASGACAADDPMTVVKTVMNQALPILRDKSTPLPQRQDKLRQIVENNFDFGEMSRSALGPHWRTLSDAQKSQFVPVFTTFIEDSYLSKVNDYTNQQIQFVRQTNDGPQYAQVFTNVVQPGQDNNLAINYRLLNNGSDWKIYDVTVQNISIIANYRNQFNRVINNQGFDQLLSDLKNKQQALAASLGTHGSND